MPSNVVNRKTVREALAALIDADSDFGSDWDVFNYKTPKFNGKARNVVVSSAGSRREITGADADESDSGFRFRIFLFVLYSLQPQKATNSPTAGSTKTINISNTANFVVGKTAYIEDASSNEYAVVSAVSTNVSITVSSLANSYTTPYVNAWTARHSEDELDLAEKNLTDLFNDNQAAANWSRLYIEGESDPDEIVDEGGQTFRREIITVRTTHYI